jgi:predicted double-glycine peptidase
MRRGVAVLSMAALPLAGGCFSARCLSKSSPPAAQSLIAVPDVRQSTDYSCGASALQSVLAYYGVDLSEGELMVLLGTDNESGTAPESIARVAAELGMQPSIGENLSLDDLRAALGKRIPVIVAFQAWVEDKPLGFSWAETWEEGHYAVVIGMDADYVYLEDPSLLGTRGRVHLREFEERWHDYTGMAPLDAGDRRWVRTGIFIQQRGERQQEPRGFTDLE